MFSSFVITRNESYTNRRAIGEKAHQTRQREQRYPAFYSFSFLETFFILVCYCCFTQKR